MSHIDTLRAEYPQLSEGFWALLRENADAERALSELRAELAELCGYHQRDGAIPVDTIRALLDGAR